MRPITSYFRCRRTWAFCASVMGNCHFFLATLAREAICFFASELAALMSCLSLLISSTRCSVRRASSACHLRSCAVLRGGATTTSYLYPGIRDLALASSSLAPLCAAREKDFPQCGQVPMSSSFLMGVIGALISRSLCIMAGLSTICPASHRIVTPFTCRLTPLVTM